VSKRPDNRDLIQKMKIEIEDWRVMATCPGCGYVPSNPTKYLDKFGYCSLPYCEDESARRATEEEIATLKARAEKAEAKVDSLEHDVRSARLLLDEMKGICTDMVEAEAQLVQDWKREKTRAEKAELDTARLDWLVSEGVEMVWAHGEGWSVEASPKYKGGSPIEVTADTLREAIDAARREG